MNIGPHFHLSPTFCPTEIPSHKIDDAFHPVAPPDRMGMMIRKALPPSGGGRELKTKDTFGSKDIALAQKNELAVLDTELVA